MTLRVTRLHRLCALVVTFVLLFNIVGCAGGGLEPGARKAATAAFADDVSTATSTLLGDLDGDGTPSVADAIAILRIVVGLDAARHLADCDQDGSAGVADAIAVLRCVVGLAAWPIGQLAAVGLDLPANGPTAAEIEVVIGGQTVVQPDAGGTVPAVPADDATCTVFALDTTTDEAMLLAVVPPAAATAQGTGAPQLSPGTTVGALLFFRLGGWMLPQDRQADLLSLFGGLPEVQAFITAFDAAYEADGHALRSMETDAALQAAFQSAVDAASVALDGSTLADDIRTALGIATSEAAAVFSQAWAADPTSSEGIDLSTSGGTVTATNNKALYRWAEVTNARDERLGWSILPPRDLPFAAPQTVLRPDPLPDRSLLTLTVNGGLKDVAGQLTPEQLVPVGLTVSLRVITPLISCIVGVRSVGRVDSIGDLFDSGAYDTGHPLVDWVLTNLVWDPDDPVSYTKPVPVLVQTLLLAIANGQVDVIEILSDWTWQTLLPEIALHIPSLAAAIAAESGAVVALSAILQALAILSVPWLMAVIKGAMIASAVITIAPTLWDLCGVSWKATFALFGDQTIGPDGQTLVWVPAGSFMMGRDDGDWGEGPVHQVTLDGFWIGQCEVTNAQYRAFCNATGRAFPSGSNQGDDHPVMWVNWYDAQAYCDYYGYSLPTEAQWEYAARGPAVPTYPWGDEWDNNKCCNGGNQGPGGWTFPVGSFPAGASWCGALDMAGNVSEWCADWLAPDYYQISPELNPPGPESGEWRVMRGGSWFDYDSGGDICRATDRRGDDPSCNPLNEYGFRVSRSRL